MDEEIKKFTNEDLTEALNEFKRTIDENDTVEIRH